MGFIYDVINNYNIIIKYDELLCSYNTLKDFEDLSNTVSKDLGNINHLTTKYSTTIIVQYDFKAYLLLPALR